MNDYCCISPDVKLSIVILCWNDLRVIGDCLHSIYCGTRATSFEVIVSDNGSNDGSIEFIRKNYPNVRLVENRANLGFAKGNNVGIRASKGEYVLILNPDTLIHDGSLDRLVAFADRHWEADGFGCRVLNSDGSYQVSARLFPTIWRYWVNAFYLNAFQRLSSVFAYEEYADWRGNSERVVDWQSGCCVMFRRKLLEKLGGFDEQFFYHFEEVDLCRRVWNAGSRILFTPGAAITHLGGQSVSRFPIRFEIEKHRSRYRYFYKHFGSKAANQCRHLSIARIRVRRIAYGLLVLFKPTQQLRDRLKMYDAIVRWNKALNPTSFIQNGEEPTLEQDRAVQAS